MVAKKAGKKKAAKKRAAPKRAAKKHPKVFHDKEPLKLTAKQAETWGDKGAKGEAFRIKTKAHALKVALRRKADIEIKGPDGRLLDTVHHR